ncbi:metalloendopeptidase CpaA [Acinetobacter sp. Marseille-Q1618]|uniref:metalloendopeptidase CpaA n=1 Tax=Acinetobacter sp. Marseille-Q1618 TaxID=2697502 RepID=UPI00156FF060|nr:metalloendopeptidase CpaA [Acinetobacter sp. Marseille-Q1618]
MKNKKLVIALSLCLVGTAFASTILSPNTNNQSGQIPSGYTELEFNLANGNWIKNLYLPKTAKNNDRITINSTAGYSAYLDTSNTDIPLESLEIKNNTSYQFVFNGAQQKWLLSGNIVYPTHNVANYNVSITSAIPKITLKTDQWAQQISLPDAATDGQLVQISSDADKESSVNRSNLLFTSSYILKKGDSFWFKYNKALNRWIPEQIKPYQVNVSSLGTTLTQVKAPITEVVFSNGNWVNGFTLPQKASDRDRIIVRSSADWAANIQNTNTNTQATLKLKKDSRYEFMYVADRGQWILMSAPVLRLQAKDLTNQQIPNMEQPTTRVQIANSNWQSSLNLPLTAKIGDKVILNSLAAWNTKITAKNGLNTVIKKDETQRYIYTATGWVADSATIDILLVNSPEVSQKLGASAAKLRLLEDSDLTNNAAENSNAQFYIRNVGYLEYKIPSQTRLLDVISTGRTDTTVQNERNRVFADAVYYQGAESDPAACGWGWVNITPSEFNMISAGNLSCNVGVMRHEFGHNLGLNHNNSNTIGQGFEHPLGSTVMGGNSLPYYSSPSLYHPKYGYRLGVDNEIDAVSLINKNAPIVAQFKQS